MFPGGSADIHRWPPQSPTRLRRAPRSTPGFSGVDWLAAAADSSGSPAGKPFWRVLLRPNRRDLLFAGAGAGLLLLLELILWIVLLIRG